MSTTIIRLGGFVLWLLGTFLVLHDLRAIRLGEPEATALYAYLMISRWAGYGVWWAYTAWLLPAIVGVMALILPSVSASRCRPRRPGI
jgi:hypothetical protein